MNPSLTLRSALEWVIDQYQVKENNRSGIRSDPNRPDDLEYMVRLVGQVVRVSIPLVPKLPFGNAGLRNSVSRSYAQSVRSL